MTLPQSERHVLIADDEPVSRLRLKAMLEAWGYRVSIASDGVEALHVLQSPESPLLAVLDWVMPGMEGIEICKRLKADPERRHVYIIMLTSNNATSDIVAALDAGADDFVAKPFAIEELRVRLRAGQRVVDLQRELHHKASHDDLTGMLNRRMVLDMLAREHARAARERTALSVAMLDIDFFKAVNDQHGHLVGDAVLQEVASRIKTSLRPYDIAGRYGGEEFLLVMPRCDVKTAFVIAERVRRAIAATPIRATDAEIVVTASLGTATMSQRGDVSHRALMAEADRALYRAKSDGRNRVRALTQSET